MKGKFIVAAIFAAIVFVAIGWRLLARPTNDAAHVDGTLQLHDSSELKIVPRKDLPKQLTQRAPAQNGVSNTPYEQFKVGKMCVEVESSPDVISQDIASLRTDILNTNVNSRAALENEIRRKETQLAILAKCGSVPVTKDELSRLLETAARQGDPEAKLAYAQDPMIDRMHSIENLSRLKDWREVALSYIKSEVNNGSSEAMVALAGAYDPLQCQPANKPFCSEMLPQIVVPDAATAYRYYYESRLTGNAPSWVEAELSTLKQYLTPDQMNAEQMAAQSALSNGQ